MHRLRFVLIVLALITPLTLMAQELELPPINPASVSGDIAIGGAAILVEATENLGVRFALDGFEGNVNVTEFAVTEAIQRFCSAEIDIILADRQITPQEANACEAVGLTPVAFRIGTKAIEVAVSPENKFIEGLTTGELQRIFSSSPNWSDIRPDWPAEIIGRFGPGTTSAEIMYFAQIVFGGDATAMTTALGAQYNDDPNLALNDVAISEFAIGIFDSVFLGPNSNFVRVVPIDNIAPRFDTISNGTYPLARPVILYTAAPIMREKPQIAEFIKYYLLNLDLELPAVNLYPASIESQQTAVNTWYSASGTSTDPVAQQTEVPPPTVTEEVIVIEPIEVEPTEVPIVVEDRQPPSPFQVDVIPLLIAARTDLEVMTTEVQGIVRPPGWSGSLDVNDPQLALLTRLDTELLAAIVYGENARPDDWFGAVGSSELAIVRDIRHDLEILADNIYTGARPQDWAGGDPIYRCPRGTQALIAVLLRAGIYDLSVINPASIDYCHQLEVDVARYAEVNLVAEGSPVIVGDGGIVEIPREAEISTELAVAFSNRNATTRVGLIPLGTQITPIARSYATGSNMTLIEGTQFRVFIEYINTNLSDEQWELLPNIDSITDLNLFCQAIWC